MQFTNYVTSLVIPISTAQLLLPSVTVAEILHDCSLDKSLGQPQWLLGLFNWRQHQIPLISFEKIAHLEIPTEQTSLSRIVVLYGNPENKVPYYAFKTRGMPHTLDIVKDLLLSAQKLTHNPSIIASVEIETRLTWLANLEYIEQMIAEMTV